MTANDLLDLLHTRYRPPEWIVLSEVRNATGFRRTPRSADALALSTYPSRGLALYGFEFKVSRGDWLRELKNPDKSVSMQSKCDRWYLVVSDPAIVQPGELPETWGLMVPHRDSLKVAREGTKNENVTWPRDFVASLVRKALDTGSARDQREAKRAYDEGVKAGVAQQESQHRYWQTDYEALQKNVKRFEEATGLRIDRYSEHRIDDLATRIKIAQRLRIESVVDMVTRYAASLETTAGQLRAATASVQEAHEPSQG